MKKKQTIEQLKEEGLVKMASDIPIPEKYMEETYVGVHVKAHQYYIDYKERIEWIAKIEDYCNSNGLIPADLIELHREVSKKKNTGLKSPKIDKSNFKEEYRKRKTGIESKEGFFESWDKTIKNIKL